MEVRPTFEPCNLSVLHVNHVTHITMFLLFSLFLITCMKISKRNAAFHGSGKYIKANSPDTKIILAEPEGAALVTSGIATPRNPDGTPSEGHPSWKPHPIQGWTPDFIPKVLEDGLPLKLHDELIICPGAAGMEMSRKVA